MKEISRLFKKVYNLKDQDLQYGTTPDGRPYILFKKEVLDQNTKLKNDFKNYFSLKDIFLDEVIGSSNKSRGYILNGESVLELENWLHQKENTVNEINNKFQRLYNLNINDISYKENIDGTNYIVVKQAAIEKNQLLEQDYENNFGLTIRKDFSYTTNKDGNLSYFSLTSNSAKTKLKDWLEQREKKLYDPKEDCTVIFALICNTLNFHNENLVVQNITSYEIDPQLKSLTIYFSDEEYALKLEYFLSEKFPKMNTDVMNLGDLDGYTSCTFKNESLELLQNLISKHYKVITEKHLVNKNLKESIPKIPSTTLVDASAEVAANKKKEVVNCR
jgi:hypothetical protein